MSEALARREKAGASPLLVGLSLGLSAAAVLGVFGLLFYFLWRKDKQIAGPLGFAMPMPMAMSPMIMPGTKALPILDSSPEGPLMGYPSYARSSDTRMRTMTLPSFTVVNSQAVPVAAATDKPYLVIVRAIDPPGQFATFSFEPGELNMTGLGTPTPGETFQLPVGADERMIRLAPRQKLYAKGSAPNVILSVLSQEA